MARKPTHKKTSFDLELVRAAAARRWPEILARLSGHDLELFDGQHHPCPKCGGTDRFRLIDADAGALLCNQCFREKNGDGFAAAQWLLGGIDFKTALERIAEYLGIEPSASSKRHSKTNADPAKDLKFLPWHEGLAETWCVLHKPGIKPAAMVAAGCRLARYRDRFTVFALPVYGPKLAAAAPVGWCLYNVSSSPRPAVSGTARQTPTPPKISNSCRGTRAWPKRGACCTSQASSPRPWWRPAVDWPAIAISSRCSRCPCTAPGWPRPIRSAGASTTLAVARCLRGVTTERHLKSRLKPLSAASPGSWGQFRISSPRTLFGKLRE